MKEDWKLQLEGSLNVVVGKRERDPRSRQRVGNGTAAFIVGHS
jgi:hypothetical protein